ncbi:hypothetical protein U1Q18_017617 [Sarracenia purpurea var. burkii]
MLASQSTSTGLKRKRASQSVRLVGRTQQVGVTRDGIGGMVALGAAADDGVPVVSGGGGDSAENIGGVGEAAGGGGGAEIKELGAGRVESKEPGDDKVSLELFDVGERGAFP